MRTLFPALSNAYCRSFFETQDCDDSESCIFVPHSYVDETKESYTIEIDVPGLRKEDLKLEVDKQLLSIHGERKERYKIKKHFNLPDDVDIDAIQAEHKDGILKLVLPKTAKAKAREIPIGS